MVFGAALLASGCIGTMDRTEGETRAEPVDVTTELDPIPAAIDEPRVIGVENPQTERLPLLNPGGVNGTRGPR